jgi:hypothetical protein
MLGEETHDPIYTLALSLELLGVPGSKREHLGHTITSGFAGHSEPFGGSWCSRTATI